MYTPERQRLIATYMDSSLPDQRAQDLWNTVALNRTENVGTLRDHLAGDGPAFQS